MRVAFSSTLARLSGCFCVVLTSLSPLLAQITSPVAVLEVPAEDASTVNSEPFSPADTSLMAEGIDERRGTQAAAEVPYIVFSSPEASASDGCPGQRLDDTSKTISGTAPKCVSSFDAVLPHCVSQTPHSAMRPQSEKPDVIKFMYPALDYVPMSCDDAFDDSDRVGHDFIFATFRKTQGGADAAQIEAADSSVAGDQIVRRASESKKTRPPDDEPADLSPRAATRSLSDIRLGESLTQLSDSGEPLPTPESLHKGSKITAPVEHHFVPAPWVGSHASRNTFQIRYQPLYFEDPNMERCGDSNGLFTEATSIAHFASRIPLLPYMMASNSPHECVNALPDCPTCSQFGPDAYLPRPTVKAIAAQAAATVAGIYIFP